MSMKSDIVFQLRLAEFSIRAFSKLIIITCETFYLGKYTFTIKSCLSMSCHLRTRNKSQSLFCITLMPWTNKIRRFQHTKIGFKISQENAKQ